MANEVGISAEQLQQLMTCSPSPNKRRANKIPIMKKETQINGMNKCEKENICGIGRLPEDTDLCKLSHTPSKETIKNSKWNNSRICVPKLQLKSNDLDVFAEEPSHILKDDTNKDSNKPTRRWKVCK